MKNPEKLTLKEEEVMSVLWKLEKAFVKEIVSELQGKNHYNTISTIVRQLEEKGFVSYTSFGKSHQYYPIIERETYSATVMDQNSNRFFEGSYKSMVSFFAQQEKITEKDLEDILELIKNKS